MPIRGWFCTNGPLIDKVDVNLKTNTMIIKHNGLSTILDDFFGRELSNVSNFPKVNYSPRLNVIETDNEFQLELLVPGFKREEINISVENNVLTLASERTIENQDEKVNYVRREFSQQKFKRSFELPESVDSTAISAEYHDGVLKMALPKKEEAKPQAPLKIEIK